ncbi:acyltransferase family protein [Cryobacterium arcticum]|nr:acyltransferase [Cryobacterium arcticum]
MQENNPPARLDFQFADGLRAIAALGVALFHTYVFTGLTGSTQALPDILEVLRLGKFAVPVFIVLSGFVLMLPVARRDDLQFRSGSLEYLKRRAKRILPPYFAAIALFLLLIWAVPLLQHPGGTVWDSKIPVTPWGVVSHFLLLHNLSGETVFQIDGPAWSVATEWQIYFAMPFLLLPIWRKFGGVVAVAVAVIAGWGIHLSVPSLDGAHFWFLGLFAFGMAAAYIVVRGIRVPHLGFSVAVLSISSIVVIMFANDIAERRAWLSETALGVVVALALVWLSQKSLSGSKTPAHLVLESRPLVWIGTWSYSAYLIHSPLLGLGNLLLLPIGLPIGVHFLVMVVVVLPLSLACAYGFHLIVERRFMTSHQSHGTTTPNEERAVA